jgi:hypothetical protein
MTITSSWTDYIARAVALFPDVDQDMLRAKEGDIGALVLQLSTAHHLTFAEAAEMVTFRLPQFVEPERLSA